MRNFLRLKRFSLLFSYYAYVDSPDYLADDLFEKHRVHVLFGDEYGHYEYKYNVIFAKCPKYETRRFEAGMKDLADVMALGGHGDYEEVCSLLMKEKK